MKNNQYTTICTVLALITTMLVVWLSPSPNYPPRGIVLPTLQQRAPTSSNEVALIASAPSNAILLGNINIEQRYLDQEPEGGSPMAILTMTKNLTASVGGNAFVIGPFFKSRVTGSTYIRVLKAQAYYVPSNR